MSDPIRDSETQSLRPGSDPLEIARQARERLDAEHPTQIGPYRILQPLGEGGMGTVYLAEQTKPIHRKVALKIIKLGMDTKSVIARFEAEREALALMNHPNVAKVFDAGATEKGRPYFVMEYVEGVPLTQYCDDKRLTLNERLHLFMQVCQAVQHAHQKGIIHRDLKPSNVLVATVDEKPSVKVIDFGIAKATQQKLTEQTFATELGILVGTPAYMSPEQADAHSHDIDTRTDIYSLGVILYELLVGGLPFDSDTLRKAALSEIQRIIREDDPPKPSARVGSAARALSTSTPLDPDGATRTVALRRNTDPKSLYRQVRGDLDWIVMKCLEKDRTRRYDTANALVVELQRYLNHEPVMAGPPSSAYRLRKFVRRNKGSVSAVAAVVLVLAGGLMTTTFMYFRAETERVRAEEGEAHAEQARAEAEQVTQFLSDTLASANPEIEGKDVTVREVMEKAANRVGEKFPASPLIEARLRKTIGTTYRSLGLLDPAQKHLGEAAAIYTRELGPRDVRTLATANNLALVVEELGHFSQAEAAQRSTLEIQRRVLGPEHPETLRSMSNLSSSLHNQGRYAEAMELRRQTLEIQRRVLGAEHPDTLASMSGLASSLQSKGRYAEAEEVNRQALEIRLRVQGAEHPNTLSSMHSVANSLLYQGRYAEAAELYRQTLEIQRRVLGVEHGDTLRSMMNLASTAYGQGRYAEAEELYRQTLELQRRVQGPEHPETLMSMGNLANSLRSQGRHAEAEELYRQTLEIQRRTLGAEHPKTLSYTNNLAGSLYGQGRYAEAEELYRQTLDVQRRVLGSEHPDVAATMQNLAEALEYSQRWAEAEELCREAGSIWAASLSEENRNRRFNANLLGRILVGRGHFAEAEPLLVGSYRASENDPGLGSGQRKTMLESLIRLYESWNAAEPGKGYAERAVEWRTKLDEFNAADPELQPREPEATSD